MLLLLYYQYTSNHKPGTWSRWNGRASVTISIMVFLIIIISIMITIIIMIINIPLRGGRGVDGAEGLQL